MTNAHGSFIVEGKARRKKKAVVFEEKGKLSW